MFLQTRQKDEGAVKAVRYNLSDMKVVTNLYSVLKMLQNKTQYL